jgi:hypothetical protein
MKLEHEAGNEMYIDYAGKKLHVVNKETGKLIAIFLLKPAALPWTMGSTLTGS